MEGHGGRSADYAQIAALIARNDLHTAEVLWNKRRDSLTGEERQALSALLERQSRQKRTKARRQKRGEVRRAGSGQSALRSIRFRLWLILAGTLALPLLLGALFWMVVHRGDPLFLDRPDGGPGRVRRHPGPDVLPYVSLDRAGGPVPARGGGGPPAPESHP